MSIRSFYILLLWGVIAIGCDQKQEEKNGEVDQVTSWLNGLQYLDHDQLDEAEAAFKKTINMMPQDPIGYSHLGLVYLRQGKYQDAEDQLQKALDIDVDNEEAQLILAEIYRQSGNKEKAINELTQLIYKNPENPKALFMLTDLYSEETDTGATGKQQEYLEKTVNLVPTNLVARMELIKVLAQQNKPDSCLKQLEELRKIVPSLTEETERYFDKTVSFLQQGQISRAQSSLSQFYQFIKVTPTYINDNLEIESPQGKGTGYPVFYTNQFRTDVLNEGESIIDMMQFTDITETSGLPLVEDSQLQSSLVAISDYDGDGDIDIYFSYLAPGAATSTYYLLKNETDSFTNVTPASHLEHRGKERAATFTDYNNDGSMDLFISMDEGNVLYENRGDGTFTEVTEKAGFNQSGMGNRSLFADLDQDGDLDLFLARNGENQFYRNNADGTFSEQASKMGLSDSNENTKDAMFGDVDNDGDLDILAINDNGKIQLYTNHRHSRFEDIASKVGLQNAGEANAIALGDYNNDGMLDICIAAGPGGKYALYQNNGDGTFTLDHQSASVFKPLNTVIAQDASFLDFDNDGYLDLLIAGIPQQEGKPGVYLFHNDSIKGFQNVTQLMPEKIKQGFGAEIGDFNSDGDQDIFMATPQGIQLIRNETGNLNHFIKVQLVGLTYGSSKNNRLGIGAQITMRSGNLFQMKTVTEPVTYFGLGNSRTVDAMRIIWPNGVPQNILDPKSKEDRFEEQVLKGSCPFLFTWNGEQYEFQKDMMWRSALGMPLAIKGEDTTYAFADISKEYLKIPGEKLKAKDGKYSIKISEELWEAVYFDKTSLVAVDHPASTDIFVDERFVLPPFPGRNLYQVSDKHLPVSVTNEKGLDLLPKISAYDFQYVSEFKLSKYQGLTENHDLIIDLGEKAQADSIYLFLRGWIFPTDASINLALTQTDKFQARPPFLQVKNAQGEWVTVIEDLGFPMGKDKMVIANLSGKFLTKDRQVKISTNMQIYWDHIFFTTGNAESPVVMQDLKMTDASLDYRGFSAMYRKGGRYGPHWMDHEKVTTGQKWRDLTGYYTRYGDVLPLLQQGDDQYIIANSGDEITINFDAENLPKLPKGWKRDFLIYSEGWVKDGDLNTMHGQTVEPLPFRNMTTYPYGKDVHYPTDEKHRQYQQKYNTRKVTTDDFKNALKPNPAL